MTFALVAGEGALPRAVANALDRPYQLCVVEGFPTDLGNASLQFRLETLGSFIAQLKDEGVSEICFAGRIPRPTFDPSKIDAMTMPMVPNMMAALQQGDDAALRVFLGFFEDAGLSVIGAHEIAPALLPQSGALGAHQPDDAQHRDIERGRDILKATGAVDIGQACVVTGGQALAIEALGGTDWMLRSLAEHPFDRPGGVLLKAAKPGQDLRIDMPVIGPDTVKNATKAGLSGIAIAQGEVMTLDQEACRAAADTAGLFIWVYS